MRKLQLVSFIVITAIAAGCAGTTTQFRSQGLDRAAFELQCPSDQLQVVELSDAQVGVSGCGKRAVYVNLGGGWINNTGNQEETVARR